MYLFRSFIIRHDLIAANCTVRQKGIKLLTFDGPGGRLARSDWILGRNRFRPCIQKVMNIKTTVLTLDHPLLSIDYRLR